MAFGLSVWKLGYFCATHALGQWLGQNYQPSCWVVWTQQLGCLCLNVNCPPPSHSARASTVRRTGLVPRKINHKKLTCEQSTPNNPSKMAADHSTQTRLLLLEFHETNTGDRWIF
ncbi:hypothetical protein WMY93_006127 [Mugilogobius chulae]|uniref:Secreted protein n=1 Tax=Mugilogobius chulae TaxID=88201 RepID=A0AAW0PSL8_9GOBI